MWIGVAVSPPLIRCEMVNWAPPASTAARWYWRAGKPSSSKNLAAQSCRVRVVRLSLDRLSRLSKASQ